MKKWIIIGAVLLVSLWLWYSGRLEWILLPGLGLLGLGGAEKAKKRYDEAQKETDRVLEDIRSMEKKIDNTQVRHDEEVKAIEEKDFTGVPLGDLLDAANERERRRADKSHP